MEPVAVPVTDLRRAYATMRAEIDAAVARVLMSGQYVLGPEVEAFEADLAELVGSAHAVGVANGTDALELALAALGVGAGDGVVTVANAGGYATSAILARGATPQYVDVDVDDLLLDPSQLGGVITSRTAAVVVTHLYGRLAPVHVVRDLCRRHRVALVEDCAQSIGARSPEGMAGSFGDAATFSFYPTKNLGGVGDGGAVVTPHADVAGRLRQLRQYGWADKYSVGTTGGRNSRLDELQAAVLRVKLPMLPSWNEARRDVLAAYARAAVGGAVRVLGKDAGEQTVAHLAVLVCRDREVVRRAMDRAGVATAVHYPVPDHLQVLAPTPSPALLVTEWATARILTVPCFPGMRDDEVRRVQDAIADAAG